jgi:hypothetical protein
MSSIVGKNNSKHIPITNGFRVTTALYGQCIPVIYGRCRIAARLIWVGNFTNKQENLGKR